MGCGHALQQCLGGGRSVLHQKIITLPLAAEELPRTVHCHGPSGLPFTRYRSLRTGIVVETRAGSLVEVPRLCCSPIQGLQSFPPLILSAIVQDGFNASAPLQIAGQLYEGKGV